MATATKVRGTWDPVAVYGAAGRLSDADLLRWVLEREARVFALGVDQALRPRTAREKPDPAQAAVNQVLADRLTDIASRAECFASAALPIADRPAGLTPSAPGRFPGMCGAERGLQPLPRA